MVFKHRDVLRFTVSTQFSHVFSSLQFFWFKFCIKFKLSHRCYISHLPHPSRRSQKLWSSSWRNSSRFLLLSYSLFLKSSSTLFSRPSTALITKHWVCFKCLFKICISNICIYPFSLNGTLLNSFKDSFHCFVWNQERGVAWRSKPCRVLGFCYFRCTGRQLVQLTTSHPAEQTPHFQRVEWWWRTSVLVTVLWIITTVIT